jgi:DNA-binding transcriptional regulator YiaG
MSCAGMATPRRRTLVRAAETLGGEQALAEALGVNVYALAGWLQGTSDAPDAAYFAALEIVANGPLNRARTTWRPARFT